MLLCCVISESHGTQHVRLQAARIAAAYEADKAAALKAAEERIPEMRRREEERANKRRADRGLKPLPMPEPSPAVLSNGDAPHAEPALADGAEDKEVCNLCTQRPCRLTFLVHSLRSTRGSRSKRG